MARSRLASYCEQREKENSEKTGSRSLRTSLVSNYDPRWRSPEASHGVDTGFENGSAAEELRRRCAWMHHGQVVMTTGYKVAARVPRAPTASSPRTRHPDHNQRAAALGSIKARPGNDGK